MFVFGSECIVSFQDTCQTYVRKGVMQVGCGGEVVFDDADGAHPGHHVGMCFLFLFKEVADL